MKRSGVCNLDIIAVYCSLIRSVVEYASPVWHSGLTKNQSDLIECVQKRCLRIIFPELSYSVAIHRDAHETLQSETETRSEIPGHETETRPRCSKIRPRRDQTESVNSRDETETRPSV